MSATADKQFEPQSFLRSLTHRPGVYQMLNAKHKVIYVGKARDLRKRVSSYFQRTHADVKTASRHHLGVITGSDEFEFLYQARLPNMTEAARMWIPLPATDKFQTVTVKSISAPGEQQFLKDQQHGNKVLFLELGPQDSGKTVAIRFAATTGRTATVRSRSRPNDGR